VRPRWKAGWKSWECCGPSPDQGLATTIPTPNRLSVSVLICGLVQPPRHRHSGIKFVMPHQRHNGDAVEIWRHRAVVYEQARLRHPRRWSRSTRCWRQPEDVWINKPIQFRYVEDGCLNTSRGVILPGSYRCVFWADGIGCLPVLADSQPLQLR
jgi:hypothetical protein